MCDSLKCTETRAAKEFTPEEVAFTETVAGQIAIALENARLYTLTDERLREKVQQLQALQRVTATLTEPAPYALSESYGLEAVPTVFLVGPDGAIENAIPGWSRDIWNALAESLGAPPLSTPDDGLRPFRPG